MRKLFNALSLSGFVLSFGLVSCSPEKHSTDVYHAVAPSIATPAGKYSLKEWDQLKNKQLELQDTLDFGSSAPSRILIQAHCRNVPASSQLFGARSSLQVWQMLPESLL